MSIVQTEVPPRPRAPSENRRTLEDMWAAQEDMITLLKERTSQWRTTTEQAVRFFSDLHKLHVYNAKTFRTLASLVTSPEEQAGTFKVGWLALGTYTSRESACYAHECKEIEEVTLTRLNKHLTRVKELLQSLEGEGGRVEREAKVAFLKKKETERDLEQAITQAQAGGVLKTGGERVITVDPWLVEKRLLSARKTLLEKLRARCEVMKTLQQSMYQFDRAHVTELGDIFKDFTSKREGTRQMSQHQNLQEAHGTVSTINSEVDCTQFARAHALDDLTLWTPPAWKDTPPHPEDHVAAPAMRGILQRKGRILSISWKDLYVVVTNCGFLYEFDSAEASDPSDSINLRGCGFAKDPETHSLEVIVPRSGFFSSPTSYIYRTKTDDDMAAWAAVLDVHIHGKKNNNSSNNTNTSSTNAEKGNEPS